MEYIETNSFSEHLLAFLMSARSTRTYFRLLREMRIERYKEGQLKKTISRMNKKGFIEQVGEGWQITKQGKMVLAEKNRFNFIPSPFAKGSPKQMIVAFDVPEKYRKERVWLRSQLKIFGYIMLQRSLWRGPGPLPAEFNERLKILKIRDGVRTFTVVGKK